MPDQDRPEDTPRQPWQAPGFRKWDAAGAEGASTISADSVPVDS